MNFIDKVVPYKKTIAAVIIGVIGWASSVVTSNKTQITAGEWIQLVTVLATALGVFTVTNNRKDVL